MLVGTSLIVAPIGFGLGIAAGMTGVIVGALCVALALAGTEPAGRGTIPISAHAVYDRGLGVGLVLSAVAFGAVGDLGAMVLFGVTGLAALVVTAVTRYSSSGY